MIVDHLKSSKPRIDPLRRGEEAAENRRKSTQMNANAEVYQFQLFEIETLKGFADLRLSAFICG